MSAGTRSSAVWLYGHDFGRDLRELIVPLPVHRIFLLEARDRRHSVLAFWFFENCPYIGTYMADARAQICRWWARATHDWGNCFGQWGLLAQDQKWRGNESDRMD